MSNIRDTLNQILAQKWGSIEHHNKLDQGFFVATLGFLGVFRILVVFKSSGVDGQSGEVIRDMYLAGIALSFVLVAVVHRNFTDYSRALRNIGGG